MVLAKPDDAGSEGRCDGGSCKSGSSKEPQRRDGRRVPREGAYIDFHLHLPWRIREARESAAHLVKQMDEAGVRLGVVIAIEASFERFWSNVTPESVRRAAAEVLDYLIYARLPYLEKLIVSIASDRGELERYASSLLEHIRPSNHVLEAHKAYPDRLLAVASYNPDLGARGVVEAVRGKGYVGVKLYPTIHFCRPSSRRLEPLYRFLESEGMLLIVHTGCDPGVWELPKFCEYARPREVAEVARKHKDLTVVIAHLGAYSALSPGIFFEEAIQALNRYDNVYADTSAVDPFYIELAVERAGDDRLLFGSDYPYVAGLSIADAVRAIESLSIPIKSKHRILWENAERLLGRMGVNA